MSLKLGQRVRIPKNNKITSETEDELSGTIRYLGKTKFAPGAWVGIELDEPAGSHSGKVNEEEYFTCPDRHGVFLRPVNIRVVDSEGTPSKTRSTSKQKSDRKRRDERTGKRSKERTTSRQRRRPVSKDGRSKGKSSEPRKSEPLKSEPRKSEPRKLEPRKLEPRKSEPRKSEPRKTEPQKTNTRKLEFRFDVPSSEPRSVFAKKSETSLNDDDLFSNVSFDLPEPSEPVSNLEFNVSTSQKFEVPKPIFVIDPAEAKTGLPHRKEINELKISLQNERDRGHFLNQEINLLKLENEILLTEASERPEDHITTQKLCLLVRQISDEAKNLQLEYRREREKNWELLLASRNLEHDIDSLKETLSKHENRDLETQLESLKQRVTDYQDLFSVIDDELECARSIEKLYIEDIQRHEKQVKHLENLIFQVYCERSQSRERNVEKPKEDTLRSLPDFNYEGFSQLVSSIRDSFNDEKLVLFHILPSKTRDKINSSSIEIDFQLTRLCFLAQQSLEKLAQIESKEDYILDYVKTLAFYFCRVLSSSGEILAQLESIPEDRLPGLSSVVHDDECFLFHSCLAFILPPDVKFGNFQKSRRDIQAQEAKISAVVQYLETKNTRASAIALLYELLFSDQKVDYILEHFRVPIEKSNNRLMLRCDLSESKWNPFVEVVDEKVFEKLLKLHQKTGDVDEILVTNVFSRVELNRLDLLMKSIDDPQPVELKIPDEHRELKERELKIEDLTNSLKHLRCSQHKFEFYESENQRLEKDLLYYKQAYERTQSQLREKMETLRLAQTSEIQLKMTKQKQQKLIQKLQQKVLSLENVGYSDFSLQIVGYKNIVEKLKYKNFTTNLKLDEIKAPIHESKSAISEEKKEFLKDLIANSCFGKKSKIKVYETKKPKTESFATLEMKNSFRLMDSETYLEFSPRMFQNLVSQRLRI